MISLSKLGPSSPLKNYNVTSVAILAQVMTISSTIFVGICLLLGLHSFTVKATSMPALLSVSRKAGGEALPKTRRHGARDDEEMAQENAAKTLPTTLAKDKELKNSSA